MRRLALLLLAGAIFTTTLTIRAADPPKLLVMVVVDQFRADYLQQFDRHWRGGFRTLLDKGLVFENARYPYLVTVTCAGHATIGTGALPHTHGMVNNTWWDRKDRLLTGCSADTATSDITYGRPVRLGNSGAHLLVPTLADELRTQKPGARVVAVSMKARSAIGLAGHGGDAVVWFDDLSGSWTTSTAFAKGVVPEVKQFVDANPYEKDLGKIWTLFAPPDSYLKRDAGVGERPPTGWNGLFPHPVNGRGGAVDAQFFALWQATPLADAYLGQMTASLVDSFKLGQRQNTDFLGVSFSVLDDVGHAFGPESREIEDVLRQLDVTLGTLIQHLDARVGRANYVLALSADHGVAPIATPPRGGRIATDDIRERIEDLLTTTWGRLEKGTYVEAVNFTDVYLSPGVFDRLRANPQVMTALTKAVDEIPGIDRTLRTDQLSETSRDPMIRKAWLSYLSARNGDLMVIPKEYWYFSGRNLGIGTTHGTPYEYDTHVPLILFGGSIPQGRTGASATPADIAPTLARLAGIRLPKAEGHALNEADR